ncbi:MAG: ATP-binding cassette domain-containing protein, partial [Deltaproteobacteria bacterium]|nr:ATP-binding cassette domain-containing protein [Deltaproteobacteria bacterium]
MTLLSLKEIHLSFGGEPLLEGVNLELAAGERVCLVGRNGCGKSTLMRVIAGRQAPDRGKIWRSAHLKFGWLEQELPEGVPGTVYEVVAGGVGELFSLLSRYHAASRRTATGSERELAELALCETEIEKAGAWQLQRRVELVLSRLKLDAEAPFATLSGGLQRRVLLARALAADPDLLLLDEPTNHLDIEAIEWLEEFLRKSSFALLFVTHDRKLVRSLATRIVELDRGKLTSWPGDFTNYLRRKEERAHAEEVARNRFDRKLAVEEEWIRKGIRARRTRNEGRVRALEEMRRRFAERRLAPGRVKMEIGRSGFAGKVVAACEDVSFAYGDHRIVAGLTT